MGRQPQGWTLRWHEPTGTWQVRFRHAGRRHERSTGVRDQRDKGTATREAARIYAETIQGNGQHRAVPPAKGDLLEWLTAWLDSLPVRGTTYTTYEKYTVYWLREWKTLREVSESEIVAYFRRRQSRVLTKTARNEASALRRFLGWAHDVGALPSPPTVPDVTNGRRHPGRHRVAAPGVSHAQCKRFLQALPAKSTGEGWPVRAYCKALYWTGLRPETIQNLRAPENYSRGARALLIAEDDDKEEFRREVPLAPEARRALDSVCPKGHRGPLFGVHRWDPYVRAAAQKALPPHIARVWTAQHLRSAAITHLLDSGGKLTGVMYLVGHKHASTTDRYIRPSLRAAKTAVTRRGR